MTKDIMVNAGFRDAPRDIPDPPLAQLAPDQHDEENMDARPDQEEIGQAINKFLQQLEKQETKGFKDLAALLSHLPKTAQGSWVQPLHVCGLGYRGWFSPSTGRRSGLYVHPVRVVAADTLRTIRYYPGISCVIPVYW